jgi:hypothetical protein
LVWHEGNLARGHGTWNAVSKMDGSAGGRKSYGRYSALIAKNREEKQ